MIRSLTRTLIGLVGLIGLGTTAQAAYVPATWTDSYDVGTGIYLNTGDSYDYTHDITLDGFNPGSDKVTNFKLTLNLFDDAQDKWYDLEFGAISVSDVVGNIFASFNLGGQFNAWSLAGVFELNDYGTLSVRVTSIFGDFLFGGSELVAWGKTEDTTSVPEPGSLALLGVGLLGLAVGTRRRKAGNAA